MKPINIAELTAALGGSAVGVPPETEITGFATDDRQVLPGDLFIAIKGSRVDGHEFAAAAISAGAVGVLAQQNVDVPHILVADVVLALSRMAAVFREDFRGPVVGITGSAGKTTTKEFVAAALSPLGQILKTQGNRNTEYTSPLLWAELEEKTRAVVVEMAMRGFGQIEHLARFTRPTIGVVTNIGYSHLLQAGDRDGIARAKGELLRALPPDGTAVLWAEDEYLGTLFSMCDCPAITFGFSGNADCHLSSYEALNWTSCRIGGSFGDERFEATLPAVGRHIALGAAAAIAVAATAGVDVGKAAAALATAELPPMRMEVCQFNGAQVLLDTYNASPPSMRAAIETFAELPCRGKRFAVIGEMKELGGYSEEAHRELGRNLAESGIDEIELYGELTALTYQEAKNRGMVVHQAGSIDEVRQFLERVEDGDAVLVKGSRSLELEKALEVELP